MSSITNKTSSFQMNVIPSPSVTSVGLSSAVQYGKVFQPQQQIFFYSPDEWQSFVQEWVHCQRQTYDQVLRFSGATDMGIDVAGFVDDKGLFGIWDNFQCKHYDSAIAPSTASVEIAKIIWHSFNGEFLPPRAYYFIAPWDCGIKSKKLMLKPGALKKYVKDNWDKQCAKEVASTLTIGMSDKFEIYFNNFEFSIFKSKTTLEVIDGHRATPYYATRFGGGLGVRPRPVAPGPMHPSESRTSLNS